jgi:transaldolase
MNREAAMSVNTVNERFARLAGLGTSVWLDQIGRGLIEDGTLARYAEQYQLRGVTSNPAIFEKAILESDDYDEIITQGFADGKDAIAIFHDIAVSDVKAAADVLRPVWDATGGYDGFVSLEVSPELARDTSGRTLEEARLFWQQVDAPNLMIKIPGTPEGLPYIEQAIYEGININITLLFSVERYAEVAEAYIRGIERRRAEGKSLDVHSVASFFVSRVDTVVDKQLEQLGRSELAGKAAVANARAAYAKFKQIFHGERFAQLKAAGAPVQRPLWASTGTKNPSYSEVIYVDTLVGPETVNTMPIKTLEAVAKISEVESVTIDEDPGPLLAELEAAGIDLAQVTDDLLDAGIDSFVHSLDGLIEGIEKQRGGSPA